MPFTSVNVDFHIDQYHFCSTSYYTFTDTPTLKQDLYNIVQIQTIFSEALSFTHMLKILPELTDPLGSCQRGGQVAAVGDNPVGPFWLMGHELQSLIFIVGGDQETRQTP